MTTARRNYTRVNRPPQAGELVGVRLQPAQLARIDAWRTGQSRPLSRPEAMRLLMDVGLDARSRAPSLFDLPDLVFADGLDRSGRPGAGVPTAQAVLSLPDAAWPEDLPDSFIVAADPAPISRSHEIAPPTKPLPDKPLDRLGPLGPLGRGRKR